MSLIEEIAKLRELEQKATPGDWFPGYLETRCIAGDGGRGEVVLRKTNSGEMPTVENLAFICKSRNLAPAMLEVLGCFREGDAKLLDRLVYEETDMAKFRAGFGKISDREQDMIDMLKRLQKAASLMEQEREKDDLGYTRI